MLLPFLLPFLLLTTGPPLDHWTTTGLHTTGLHTTCLQVAPEVLTGFETALLARGSEKEQRNVIRHLVAQAGGEEVGAGVTQGGGKC